METLLALPKETLWASLEVWDKDGRIIFYERKKSDSFVKQYYQIILAQAGAQNMTVKDNGGTNRTVASTGVLQFLGTINQSLNGIVIGTSSTAVDIADYQLGAQIAHGTGSGQMVHQAQTNPTDVTTTATQCTFAPNRNFNNNSGASITVAEMGIYTVTSSFYFCIARHIPTSVAVPDSGGCKATFTFTITE